MAVYASLVSLIHVINRTQNPPSPYAFLEKLQTQTLFDQVSFLLEFVEEYSQTSRRSKEIELLESRIAVAAYAAEDIIEAFVVDQIKRKSAQGSTTVNNSYAISSEGLEKVVQEMDLIMKEVLKIKDDHKHFNEKNQQQQQDKHSIEAAGSSSLSSSIHAKAPPPPFGGKKNTMVGFDDDLTKLKEKLTTDQRGRLVIPITGMGGIGKTTLATNTYDDPFVKNYFDIRAWVTISQDFSLRRVILGLLNDMDSMRDMSDEELGEKLHKFLFGRKYLIVLDDIWSITTWDEISRFLPDNGNGSRIMMTTRLSVLAFSLRSPLNSSYEMKFLDDDVSWNLLSEKVFGGQEQVCPPELEEIGRIIAKNCSGLPLAIVVIGGLLQVSDKTREYWSEVVENVSSIVNKENDEQCLRILSLSYNQLPIQLKPLFLYMAIFPEDSEISVSSLIRLWVAEGFLKPPANTNKTLEEIAKNYFKDLIGRNLIMVQKQDFRGNIKTCKIHDLLRDLCLREAHKERFLCAEKMYDGRNDITCERRLGMHSNASLRDNESSTMSDLRLKSLARTVVMGNSEIPCDIIFNFNLLRVVHADEKYEYHSIMELVNLRYLKFTLQMSVRYNEMSSLPWNLETLVAVKSSPCITLPSEIWEMQHLRHLNFKRLVQLSKPNGLKKYCILNNLQTLSKVLHFRFTDDILGRIPNLKKLSFTYVSATETEKEMSYFHINLVLLQKLEILKCEFFKYNYHNLKICLNFPPTLRKLTLCRSRISWENMNIIGSLPNLEVLKLRDESFCGREWNSIDQGEDQFQSLKFLSIFQCDLQIWRADSTTFPALEHLDLESCKQLEEIPWGIGEIPSLQSITLSYCTRYLVNSTEKMVLEAREQGNDDLLIKEYYTSDHDLSVCSIS